jgi:hemerythrin-like domain-containing protein
MTDRSFSLDMGMMYAMHDALRRELERLARISAHADDDPRRILRTAAGWQMFKSYLLVHHTAEDDAVWAVMEQELADQPDDLALLQAMELEHAAIDPLLKAIDAAATDWDGGPERLGGLVDELNTKLRAHLKHEESEGLALIDSTLTPEQWQDFANLHRDRIGADAAHYLPWLLDGASEARVEAVLSRLPEWGQVAYRNEWRTAYAELDLWTPALTFP